MKPDCSEQTAREMDDEVKKLLGTAYDQAKQILVSHRDQLELVATELLKSETIDGPTFYRLVNQEMPTFKDRGELAAAAAVQSKEEPTFARKGATIVAVDLNQKAAEETAGIIDNEGGNVIALSADVTQSSAVENVVSTQKQRIRPEYESLGHEGVNP